MSIAKRKSSTRKVIPLPVHYRGQEPTLRQLLAERGFEPGAWLDGLNLDVPVDQVQVNARGECLVRTAEGEIVDLSWDDEETA